MQNRPKRKLRFQEFLIQPRQILNLSRASIYIFIGGYLFFQPFFLPEYPYLKYLFCGVSIVYGLYRWYRIYADYKVENR